MIQIFYNKILFFSKYLKQTIMYFLNTENLTCITAVKPWYEVSSSTLKKGDYYLHRFLWGSALKIIKN